MINYLSNASNQNSPWWEFAKTTSLPKGALTHDNLCL